jgi:hypothetical protein
VDHRKAKNPYMSRYGEGWKQHVKNSCMLKGYVDVRDMVRHIYKKSEELMKGTLYEDRWFFYHDALSLMKAQDTKKWMEEEGILKHWILPENDLNKERPRYMGHPIGNSPEFMPLDCSLNNDLDDELWRHILYTRFLEEDDPRKFSISTPLRGSRAIERVWKNSVPSKRIKQDVYKVLVALREVYKAEGCIVKNLGNRNGRRALEEKAARQNKRGGKRKRMATLDDKPLWIHEDAQEPRQEMLIRSMQLHRSDMENNENDIDNSGSEECGEEN